ncbi:conserved membrane hypothetical protein [Microbacterium sp. C448]|uniref:DUF2304 domain-containing protein n=1 Tax=Microbacterium sp. C448 TaxID=1177594 RepID=UPI0003DE4B3F|nr:DUF2304 domain-containing protein [Microbacterium sp. C448]CDK01546.1 conserved membrane hypothetical protein [Microbacterium sp. C448]
MIVPIGIAFALVVLAIILVLLLRRQLSEKYAALWIVIGLSILILAIFPGTLGWLAAVLGVEVPANLLFALALALLIAVTLHLSWELSTSEEEVRRVAEEVAIIRGELDAVREVLAERRPAANGTGEAATPDEVPPSEPPRDERS